MVELTGWTKDEMLSHRTEDVDDLLTAHYWDKYVALRPRDGDEDAGRSVRGRPIDDMDVAELQSDPRFTGVPAAALKKAFRRPN